MQPLQTWCPTDTLDSPSMTTLTSKARRPYRLSDRRWSRLLGHSREQDSGRNGGKAILMKDSEKHPKGKGCLAAEQTASGPEGAKDSPLLDLLEKCSLALSLQDSSMTDPAQRWEVDTESRFLCSQHCTCTSELLWRMM